MAAAAKYQPSESHLKKVAECLGNMPLATVPELANGFGISARWTYESLALLEERGQVESIEIAAAGRRSKRWWPTGRGDHRHDESTMVRLMDNPLSLHWFYYILPMIRKGEKSGDQRELLEFSWFRRRAFDAAARFNDGWVAFIWSGFWQNRKALRYRFERFSEMVREEGSEARSWPSLFCFVAADRWQGRMVMDVAKEFGMDHSVCVCTVQEHLLFGDADYAPGEGRGWLLPPAGAVLVEGSSVKGGLERSLARWSDSSHMLRLLMTIEEWPGITARMLAYYTRSAWSFVKEGLQRLLERGLIREVGKGFAASRSWLSAAARRDRVWQGTPGKMFSDSKLENLYVGRIAGHEMGLMRMMQFFAADGCTFASGWRCVDNMGRSGQIAPDAAVWIEEGPFGRGWHYVEYELRIRQQSQVGAKLRGYLARLRSDRYPVLMVCRPRMEQAFREAGEGLDMLITTVREARAGPLVGRDGTVWRNRGEPVQVLTGREETYSY